MRRVRSAGRAVLIVLLVVAWFAALYELGQLVSASNDQPCDRPVNCYSNPTDTWQPGT